jgi:hypothetical protein
MKEVYIVLKNVHGHEFIDRVFENKDKAWKYMMNQEEKDDVSYAVVGMPVI